MITVSPSADMATGPPSMSEPSCCHSAPARVNTRACPPALTITVLPSADVATHEPSPSPFTTRLAPIWLHHSPDARTCSAAVTPNVRTTATTASDQRHVRLVFIRGRRRDAANVRPTLSAVDFGALVPVRIMLCSQVHTVFAGLSRSQVEPIRLVVGVSCGRGRRAGRALITATLDRQEHNDTVGHESRDRSTSVTKSACRYAAPLRVR